MTLISTVTVGSGGASYITFDNVPQTFTDLQLVVSARYSVTQVDGLVAFNSSGANGSFRRLIGNGSGASSASGSSMNIFVNPSDSTANTFGNTTIYIPNYTSSTNKSLSVDSVTENNATLAYTGLYANLWSVTSAITKVEVGGYNMVQNSTASLYGILKGSGGATTSP
jgi:hypothetical protein